MNDEQLIQDLRAGDNVENEDRNIEEQIRNLCDRTSLSMDRRILNDLTGRLQESQTLKPTLTSAGIWRMIMVRKRIKLAAAAVVALAVMLPVGYAAVGAVMKYFIISEDEVSFQCPDPNGGVVSFGFGYYRTEVVTGTDIESEEQARAKVEEFRQLYLAGKAREIRPGVWQAVLSNGERFNYGGDPERATAEFTPEEREQLKKQFDEINELRKAGKGEKTFLKEIERDGVKIRLYEVRYTLSDGEVVTFTEGVGTDGGGGSSGNPVR